MLLALNKQVYGQLGGALQVLIGVSLWHAWNGDGSGSLSWNRVFNRDGDLSRRGNESTRDGRYRNGSTAIINKGSASIAASMGSGYLIGWVE